MPRKHIIVAGRVQGVGFRYHAQHLANANCLTGWVRNLNSGEVALEVQGPQSSLVNFITQLNKGTLFIRIDDMQIEDCPEIHESYFEIRHENI